MRKAFSFPVLLGLTSLLGATLACYTGPRNISRIIETLAAPPSKQGISPSQPVPSLTQSPVAPPNPLPVASATQTPAVPANPSTARNYQGEISTRLYLDPKDNTWKCDDSTLYNYSFTLHFYPDNSLVMDNTQLNYSPVNTTFNFQPNSALTGRYDGSDPTSADYTLIFPGAASGDYSTLEFIETLNEDSGAPGACAYEFSQIP